MKLYEVPRGSMIRVIGSIAVPPGADEIQEGEILKLNNVDGMYSNCKNEQGETVYLSAVAEVKIIS